jgi:hypothetical protein
MAVTPGPGLVSVVAAGGTAVTAVGPNPNGGYIQNPASAADQGVAAAEPLYINPVTTAGVAGYGTTFALAPGETWFVIPGQTTSTSVNAASSGHRFTVVVF